MAVLLGNKLSNTKVS